VCVLCCADVKNTWSYTYTPPYVFEAWDLNYAQEHFLKCAVYVYLLCIYYVIYCVYIIHSLFHVFFFGEELLRSIELYIKLSDITSELLRW